MAKPPPLHSPKLLINKQRNNTPIPLSARRPTRRRKRSTPRSAVAGPSSSVLSLLATITAASSTVDGSPLVAQPTPPTFLCPSIDCDIYNNNIPPYPSRSQPPAGYSGAQVLAAHTGTHRRSRKRAQLADRYEKGPDGRWRQADGYTLYGSTICSTCAPTSTGIDDAIESSAPSTSLSSATATSSSSSGQLDAKMPTGWEQSTDIDQQRVTVILSVSLVLSVLICFFISGFLIWRRKKRRERESSRDEEIKLTKRTTSLTEEELKSEQEAKAKQKFWARQSARWKTNIRTSARRRRNRRLLATAHGAAVAQSSAVSLQDGPALSRSTSISTIRSRGPETTSSSRMSLHDTDTPDDSTPSALPPPTHMDDPGPSSPPAYIPGELPSTSTTDTKRPHTYESEDENPFASQSHLARDETPHPRYTPAVESANDDPISYEEDQHQHAHHYHHTTGHVATDDKNLLSQMSQMASAPHTENEESGSSSHVTGVSVSAPVWYDEELEVALDASRELLSEPSSSSMPLPPPPSKGKMAAPQFYGDPYSFEEDVHSLEPSYEPSAPPFEEHATTPSAPPLEDGELAPSAPPFSEDIVASAPPPHDEEHVGQDHDRLGPLSLRVDLPLYRV